MGIMLTQVVVQNSLKAYAERLIDTMTGYSTSPKNPVRAVVQLALARCKPYVSSQTWYNAAEFLHQPFDFSYLSEDDIRLSVAFIIDFDKCCQTPEMAWWLLNALIAGDSEFTF